MNSTENNTTSSVRAFDVLFGEWRVHNRKLRDVTDPSCDEWVEFTAMCDVFPVLGGTGHIDRIRVPEPADGPAFEGLTLRLHDPEADSWSIRWMSSRAPGRLDPPVIGRAGADGGVFHGDDVIGGRPVQVRFTWDWSDRGAPIWRQAFSSDGGGSWRTNWEMRLLPAGAGR